MTNSPLSFAELVKKETTRTCAVHGDYMARMLPAILDTPPIYTNCPTCVSERREAERLAAERREQREQSEKIAALLRRSEIPIRFADRTLANYKADSAGQKRVLKIAERYVEAFDETRGISLVLAGAPGTGKTHIACGIANQLMHLGKSALFITVLQALRHIKETYRRDSERTESEAIGDFISPKLLILDEIGVQFGSEHEKTLMFDLLNERYQQCRSTILISNLNTDELSEFMGDRVMDRFRESGAIVAFDWESYRKKVSL